MVKNRTRVTIVRHHSERFRSSNTGRLASMALTNCEIVDHGGATGDARFAPATDAMLLFPTGDVRDEPPTQYPSQLIVLDATWSQARRMWRKLDVLRGIETLRLPEISVAAPRLRKSPGPGQVSTIEAIAAALRWLEGDDIARPLEVLFDDVVDRMRSIGRNGIAQRTTPTI
jgi:DTW domain-containing protein